MSDTTYKSKVGYKPPVELDYHEGTPEIKSVWDNMRDAEGKILDQMEEHIVAQCRAAVGVKIDREELIKALRYDRGQYEKGYADGKRDAADAIEALQAEVKRLKEANEELREKQTYIDHYGTEWMTSAKDVPNYAYEHGYADGMAEVKAQLPKQGKWIWDDKRCIYVCSICGSPKVRENMDRQIIKEQAYCHFCGAKMEVQE